MATGAASPGYAQYWSYWSVQYSKKMPETLAGARAMELGNEP